MRFPSTLKVIVLFALTLFVSSNPHFQAQGFYDPNIDWTVHFALPGDLDPAFGPVGFTTTNLSPGGDRAHAIARQSDGKIVAAGRNNINGLAIVRYNPDGSLDGSFDGDGVVTLYIGTASDGARAVAIQNDGKIVIVTSSTSAIFTVVRLNPNGSLDTSFDGDGILTNSTAGTPFAGAIQPDGKIVTAGNIAPNLSSTDFSIVRLNENGSFDTTFDSDGKVSVEIGNTGFATDDLATSIALQLDGKIVVGGQSDFTFTGRDWAVVRLNPDGALDTSFGIGGKVRTTFGGNNSNESINAIAVEASGRITAVGHGVEGGPRGFAVARYNGDGSPDLAFSGDGRVVTPTSGNGNEQGWGVAVQPDGKIIAAGYSGLEIAVLRYNNDGILDTTFSGDGKIFMTIYQGGGQSVARGVLVEPNGNIVLAGHAGRGGTSDEDIVIARFGSDGIPSADFGTFGYIITNPFNEAGGDASVRSVTVQSDGKIVVGANRIASSLTTFGLIIRYTPEGALDPTFGSSPTAPGIAGVRVPNTDVTEVNSVILQPDGKILVAGTYEGFEIVGLFVARLNSNGSPDTSFGGANNGYAAISSTDGGGPAQDIVLQPDGKILVAATAPNLSNQTAEFAVYRLNADGSHDTSFGVNGVARTDVGTGNDVPFAIALQLDGRILIGGATNFGVNSNADVAVLRFTANGALDCGFGIGGKVITPLSGFTEAISDIKLQSDGKIVASGTKCDNFGCSSKKGVLLRYTSNGSLDGSFDEDGVVSLQIQNSVSSDLASLAVQSNGKIVAAGTSVSTATQSDSLVVRYNNNGTIDSTFSVDGIATNDIGGSHQQSHALTLQADGNIVTAGSHLSGTRNDIVVWRHVGDTSLANRTAFDFEGDGMSDVAILRPGPSESGGKVAIGGFGASVTAVCVSTFMDFDGDRKTDLGIYRPGPGEWWWLRSSTGGNSALQFGAATDRLAPVDFTGDGKTDVAFWRPETGQWFVLRSEDFSFYAFPFGATGDVPVPADFDGDGKADPAVFRESSSTWFINKSTGGTDIFGFGSAGDKTAVADYDGDGKADVAIFRPVGVNGAEWWVRRSSDAAVVALQFGSSTDKAVPGDFTGDGKADIAFWRPSTGFWNVLRSEDLSYFAFPFGTTGDVPVAGDYDGDGKTDAGVFRPSNSTWFIQRSTAGTLIQQFGATGDVPLPSAFVR
ncbi:MAG: VCBS repeat-containing protein [Acidobacteria bacterium]|nr:VCBS repeat-containing protein [Acidobacteriota bacterium]